MDGREGIYSIEVQSGTPTPVVLGGFKEFAGSPQPSRDGQKLFFERRTKNGDIALIERQIASGREREIMRRAGLGAVSLSPDDRLIAATATDTATNTSVILIVPVDGGPIRELIRSDSREAVFRRFVAWVPDQRHVVVRKDSTIDVTKKPVLLLSVSGGEPPRTIDLPGLSTNAAIRINPNGRDVAFVGGEYAAEVWVLENFLPKPTRH